MKSVSRASITKSMDRQNNITNNSIGLFNYESRKQSTTTNRNLIIKKYHLFPHHPDL